MRRKAATRGRRWLVALSLGTAVVSAGAVEFTTLHEFNLYPTNRPADPLGDLVALAGQPGSFAGVSSRGGNRADPRGTVYATDLQGRTKVLHAFAADNEGLSPTGSLVQGPDGSLYGTAYMGGRGHGGTVFRVGLDGAFAVIHHFDDADGNYPAAGLTVGADGAFYGTTTYGGPYGAGGIFRIDAAGQYALVHAFGEAPDTGADPYAEMTLARDGSLWGTTRRTGRGSFNESEGNGTVFRYAADGSYAIVHRFTARGEGCLPMAALAEGDDGWFYGTAEQCGSAGARGTVFRVSAAGAFETLHAFFAGPADGSLPESRLVRGSDGRYYGTTIAGGSDSTGGKGTVYRLDADGRHFEVLHVFECRKERVCHPYAGLVEVAPQVFLGADGGLKGEGSGATYLLDVR